MLIPVILSGGAGTRLWPVSREAHPKPFIKLEDGQSLLRKAYLRAASLRGVGEMLTVTQRDNYFKTEDEYRSLAKVAAGTNRLKIKRIVVKPNASLFLQKHRHRSEHWVVVSGSALVVNGDRETLVRPNDSAYIPIGVKHRLVNPGVIDCVMIEVQVGDYLGKDDTVRFDASYGRS